MFIVDRSRQHVSTLKGSSSGLLFETNRRPDDEIRKFAFGISADVSARITLLFVLLSHCEQILVQYLS